MIGNGKRQERGRRASLQRDASEGNEPRGGEEEKGGNEGKRGLRDSEKRIEHRVPRVEREGGPVSF